MGSFGQVNELLEFVVFLNWFLESLCDSRLLKFEGCSRCMDNHFISELVANGNIIGNSQTAKQMKDLRFKYEITL